MLWSLWRLRSQLPNEIEWQQTMSSNLTVVWPNALLSVSDRRLTRLKGGNILTNRSTKMTVFACSNAYGTIVYNGIGLDELGKTPSDWIMSLAEQHVFDLPLAKVLEQIVID